MEELTLPIAIVGSSIGIVSLMKSTYNTSYPSSELYILTIASNSSLDNKKLTVASTYLNYFGDTLFLPNLSQS